MFENQSESIVLVYSVAVGLAVAVLVGLAGIYSVWRRGQTLESERLQKCLIESLRRPAA